MVRWGSICDMVDRSVSGRCGFEVSLQNFGFGFWFVGAALVHVGVDCLACVALRVKLLTLHSITY